MDELHARHAATVLDLMRRCTEETRYQRFHGFSDGVSYAAQLFSPQKGSHAFGAWAEGVCVGLGNLATMPDGFGEVGILVQDGWQRTGVGWALVRALRLRALELGLPGLTADLSPAHDFLLSRLSRIGQTTVFRHSDGYTVRIHLGADASPGFGPANPSITEVRS